MQTNTDSGTAAAAPSHTLSVAASSPPTSSSSTFPSFPSSGLHALHSKRLSRRSPSVSLALALAQHSTNTIPNAASAARTSPRLDVTTAFFSGIPRHSIRAVAAYVTQQPDVDKQYLLTASDMGELVHWTYLPCTGYRARALLIPPTPALNVSNGYDTHTHRRAHWMPSVSGASLIDSSSNPSSHLSGVTCVASCRVASKEVFVTADANGGIAQWSIDGDCCYCHSRLLPFAVEHMTISTISTSLDSNGFPVTGTYAICASSESPLIFIIDLLQMHVIRCCDITPEEQYDFMLGRTIAEESEAGEESYSANGDIDAIRERPIGISGMYIRYATDQDMSMIPSRVDTQQLVVMSTRGCVSVWNVTNIVLTTLQLSTETHSSAPSNSIDPSSAATPASPNVSRRSRTASTTSSFFASLPPLDSAQSACISAPVTPLAYLASTFVCLRVYSAPLADVAASVCSSAAYVLIVMQQHFIVLDANTFSALIPLQSIRDYATVIPQTKSNVSATDLSSLLPASGAVDVPLPPLPPLFTCPLPSIPDSSPPTASRRSSLRIQPPAESRPLPANPSPMHSNSEPLKDLSTLHEHSSKCRLMGGTFVFSPNSTVAAVNYPHALLWSSCGEMWLVGIFSDRSNPHVSATPLTLFRSHSNPESIHRTEQEQHTQQHQPPAIASTVAIFQRQLSTEVLMSNLMPFVVHTPTISGDIGSASVSSTVIPILVCSTSGSIVEYQLDLTSLTRSTLQLIKPVHHTHFTDSFATPSYLHRFGHPHVKAPSAPLMQPSNLPLCSSLLVDLVSDPEHGMSSLLIQLIKGHPSGKLEFFKILTSEVPIGKATADVANLIKESIATKPNDAYHSLIAHRGAITSLLTFQSNESTFSIPLLVSASLDCSIAVWECRTSQLIVRLHVPSPVIQLTRPRLLSGNSSNDPTQAGRIPVNISCIDTEVVCVISADHSLRLLSLVSMSFVSALRGHDSLPLHVFRDEWAIANDILFVVTQRHSVFVWTLSSNSLNLCIPHSTYEDAIDTLLRFPSTHGLNNGRHSHHHYANSNNSLLPAIPDSPGDRRPSAIHTSTSAHQRSYSVAGVGSGPSSPQTPASPIGTLRAVGRKSVMHATPSAASADADNLVSRPRTASTSQQSSPSIAPAHSTSLLTTSQTNPSPGISPVRMQRSITAPNSLSDPLSVRLSPFASNANATVAPAATTHSTGMKAASWAVHYGLQRLWKLGGKGGLWNVTSGDSTSHPSSDDHSSAVKSASSSFSNLICSFESVPSLQLSLFSVDIGYFTAEIKHAYAPLDASSDSAIPRVNGSSTAKVDAQHRAEVYKEVLKLIMDWNDELKEAIESVDDDLSAPSHAVQALDILRLKFRMRAPHTSRGSRHGVGGSLPTCYACYSPTNNALTILLPTTCSTSAQRDLLGRRPQHARDDPSTLHLSHLSRWSIGPNFSANQSLCLTTVLMALIGSSDYQLHSYYSLLEAFYNATLPTLNTTAQQLPVSANSTRLERLTKPLVGLNVWKYSESDIPFLSSFALHEHEDIRRASRLLVQSIIGRMPLTEIWNACREWSAFYDNMGTAAPPPLPWSDLQSSAFPAPPRYVSDFEFMTGMLLCYLYHAQARRLREDGANTSSKSSSVQSTPKKERSSSIIPSQASFTADDELGSVISLDASMFGLSELKVQASPKRMLSMEDEAKHDAECANISPTSTQAPITPVPPSDKTPWIISTLLRLLSQTHQDSTLHSIQKSSICIELLIQGLSQTNRSPLSSGGEEVETNPFWKFIPTSALEPLYRIIFDLSFVPPSTGEDGKPAASSATASPQLAFSSNCRVLLVELSKFAMPHFIEWVRKEIFGYTDAQGQNHGGDLNGMDLPTAAAKKHANTNPSTSAPASLSLLSSGCAAFKANHFDEYRYQLVCVLASLPKKFPTRMNVGVLKCMIEVLIRTLDPFMVSQNMATAATAAAKPTTPHNLSLGVSKEGSLRARLLQVLSPFFQYLSSRYHWVSYCALTMKLSIAENLRWIYYERCGLGFYKLGHPAEDAASLAQLPANVDPATASQQEYLLTQAPLIHIYDLHTATKWRTFDGHPQGSEIDAISFSNNGHLLASYSFAGTATPTVRIWSTDYESSSVGSGFLPTRFLMKAVFKMNPYCLQVLDLPPAKEAVLQNLQKQRRESMLHMHGVVSRCQIMWKDNANSAVTLTREDDTVVTLKL